MRRYSNPRKPKLPPLDRSTFRLFSSLISTLSFVISSRSRFSSAPERCRSNMGKRATRGAEGDRHITGGCGGRSRESHPLVCSCTDGERRGRRRGNVLWKPLNRDAY